MSSSAVFAANAGHESPNFPLRVVDGLTLPPEYRKALRPGEEWKDATGRPAIDLYLTYDGGHSWPGGLKPRDQADPPSTAFNATDLIWAFFQKYTLP